MKKVSVSGGPVQTLCEAAEPFGASWSADGAIIFSAGDALYRVSASGGLPTPLTHLDAARGDVRHAWPDFLPDGRQFLFFVTTADASHSAVYQGSLDGGTPQKVPTTPPAPPSPCRTICSTSATARSSRSAA